MCLLRVYGGCAHHGANADAIRLQLIGTEFSPPTLWVPGIDFKLSGSGPREITGQAILSQAFGKILSATKYTPLLIYCTVVTFLEKSTYSYSNCNCNSNGWYLFGLWWWF